MYVSKIICNPQVIIISITFYYVNGKISWYWSRSLPKLLNKITDPMNEGDPNMKYTNMRYIMECFQNNPHDIILKQDQIGYMFIQTLFIIFISPFVLEVFHVMKYSIYIIQMWSLNS
jgi:hypothetical protein